MTITPDRLAGIARLLMDDGYTQGQAEQAEPWLLRGDWTYKGAGATLMLSDFYVKSDDTNVKVTVPSFDRSRIATLNEPFIYFGELVAGEQFSMHDSKAIYTKINSSQAIELDAATPVIVIDLAVICRRR